MGRSQARLQSTQAGPDRLRLTYAPAALIALAAIACYVNSLSNPFVYDDHTAIVANPAIRSVAGVAAQGRNLPTSGRPIVTLSFAVNYTAGGIDPFGYHLANLGIHIGTALLLFGVVRRTLLRPPLEHEYASRAGVLALAIALLWVVHPLNTEAVDYITQRTESLMALMFVGTLYAAIRSLESLAAARWGVVAVAASALGMACKESMVVAPLLVALYDRVFVFGDMRQAARRRWPLYVWLALTWLVLAYLVVPAPRAGSAGFAAGVAVCTYLLNQAVMIVHYLRLAIWPTDLVANYGRPLALTFRQVWPHVLAIGGLLAATVFLLVRRPAAGFLGAWMFLTLAPTSSFVPIATEVGAERRMYLPLMALIAFAVLVIYHASIRQRVGSLALGGVAIAAVVLPLGALTVARNAEYASALTLAETTLARWPSPVAHGMVGGELAALHQDRAALEHLRAAADADPRARYNLGITLFNLTDYDGAIRELETLAREYPMREEAQLAHRGIAGAYARQENWPAAIREYRRALSMVPSDQDAKQMLRSALVNYGNSFGAARRFEEAAAAFRDALAVDPSNAIARHGLATARYDMGDMAGAVADAQLAVAADPSHTASYVLMARAYAMQDRWDAAVEQFQRALQLSPGDRQIQNDLQMVLAARQGSNGRGPVVK